MKLAIWTMQQDVDHCESAGQSPMLDILSKELDLSPEQTSAIKKQRCDLPALLCMLNQPSFVCVCIVFLLVIVLCNS